jgi:FixJ family two-component response regulator
LNRRSATHGTQSFVEKPDRELRNRLDALSQPNNAGASRPLTGISVLVVDDDLGTRETFEWTLRPLGVQVRTARSAGEGLQVAESHSFDLLLVDLQLPDMPGTDMIRILRHTRAAVAPFVLISAFLTTPFTVEAMRLGAVDVLEKPISVDDLPGLVSTAVRQTVRSGPLGAKVAAQQMRLPAHSNRADITEPGSAAERWVKHALKACHSTRDLKTLEQWSICAGVSYTALRECCELAGMRPGDARDLVRVLRAVIRAPLEGCLPDVLLNVSDRRTLDSLLDKAGLKFKPFASLDDVFEHQKFVSLDNAALRLLRTMLTGSTS